MRFIRSAFLPVSVALLIWAGAVVPLPQYVQQPGGVVGLSATVLLEAPASGEIQGEYQLTTVNLRPASAFDLVRAAVLPGVEATPSSTVIPEGVDVREYFDRQREVFRDAGQLAAAVGLCAAEFYAEPCRVTGDGALVTAVVPGSAADGVLAPGDVIVRAGGRQVATDVDLREAIASLTSGASLQLVIRRDEEQLRAEVAPRPVAEVSEEPILGVSPAILNPRIDQPVPVEITSRRIGGPSAGLMIALTVFDKANTEIDLAAGRIIAGTGTLDADGNVGPIGGIRFKVVAAVRARADLFLAPAGQAAAAREALPEGSDLTVVGVESLDDAINALQAGTSTGAAQSS